MSVGRKVRNFHLTNIFENNYSIDKYFTRRPKICETEGCEYFYSKNLKILALTGGKAPKNSNACYLCNSSMCKLTLLIYLLLNSGLPTTENLGVFIVIFGIMKFWKLMFGIYKLICSLTPPLCRHIVLLNSIFSDSAMFFGYFQ